MFENWSTFAEVMIKSHVYSSFLTHSVEIFVLRLARP